MKKLFLLLLSVFCMDLSAIAYAAPVEKLRTSISPARVRVVLDSKSPIDYKVEKNGLKLQVEMPHSSAKKQQLQIKDTAIKGVDLKPLGRNSSLLNINLAKDCQYKVYRLTGPDRLVIDIFRINIIAQTKTLAKGVTSVSYTHLTLPTNSLV